MQMRVVRMVERVMASASFSEPDRHSAGRGPSHVGDRRVKGDGGSTRALIRKMQAVTTVSSICGNSRGQKWEVMQAMRYDTIIII